MKRIISNKLINSFLLISLIGVLDSAYLLWSHWSGEVAGCFIVEGCDVVLRSPYAEVAGIPVALGGFVFYLVIFIGFFVYNFNHKAKLLRFLAIFTTFGFLATLWFLYLQAFVIKAFCSYCLISAITSTLLFAMGIYILKKGD